MTIKVQVTLVGEVAEAFARSQEYNHRNIAAEGAYHIERGLEREGYLGGGAGGGAGVRKEGGGEHDL